MNDNAMIDCGRDVSLPQEHFHNNVCRAYIGIGDKYEII